MEYGTYKNSKEMRMLMYRFIYFVINFCLNRKVLAASWFLRHWQVVPFLICRLVQGSQHFVKPIGGISLAFL